MTPNIIISTAIVSILLTLVLQRKHMLMILLLLEALILTLSLALILFYSSNTQNYTQMFIVLLTLGACEASLGLSLLVSMTRHTGSDYLNLLSSNKC